MTKMTGPTIKPGIFSPVPTFFDPQTEDLDYEATAQHIIWLAKLGIPPVVLGSTGEATHLLHSERVELVKYVVKTVRAAGLDDIPILVGCGAGSTRETLMLCAEAKAAGASAAMVITPGYNAKALDRRALVAFYKEVCDKSPLPIFIYNFPASSAGIDLDSDFIIEISEACPNAVGVKLTCGSVGKVTRLVAHPRSTARGGNFLTLNGLADHLLPSMSVRSGGAITGLANVCPKLCLRLYDLADKATDPDRPDPQALQEAMKLQGIVSHADWVLGKAGFAGTKYALQQLRGYGGNPRRPLLPYDAAQWPTLKREMEAALKLENSL